MTAMLPEPQLIVLVAASPDSREVGHAPNPLSNQSPALSQDCGPIDQPRQLSIGNQQSALADELCKVIGCHLVHHRRRRQHNCPVTLQVRGTELRSIDDISSECVLSASVA